MQPTFFESPAEFRTWLETHHERATELWVGYYKKATGRPSLTWPESVDEALCVGWIDGLRKSLGEDSYMIRFTPRKSSSIWSNVNIGRVAELSREGRMCPAGLRAFAARKEDKSGVYSFEQKEAAKLDPAQEQQFRANGPAWEFFQAQPAGYRRTAIWRVVSAKKEETRLKRLMELIEDSAQGRTIKQLTRPGKQG